jgi:hypothetical protein
MHHGGALEARAPRYRAYSNLYTGLCTNQMHLLLLRYVYDVCQLKCGKINTLLRFAWTKCDGSQVA